MVRQLFQWRSSSSLGGQRGSSAINRVVCAELVSARDRLHACENDRGIPGTGQVNWTGIAQALKEVNYQGTVVIESFTPQVKSIAKAVCIWREIAPDQDSIAFEGLAFLKQLFQ